MPYEMCGTDRGVVLLPGTVSGTDEGYGGTTRKGVQLGKSAIRTASRSHSNSLLSGPGPHLLTRDHAHPTLLFPTFSVPFHVLTRDSDPARPPDSSSVLNVLKLPVNEDPKIPRRLYQVL